MAGFSGRKYSEGMMVFSLILLIKPTMHPKKPIAQNVLFFFLPLNDTPLTNFPSLALTHPILKKQHTDFITAALADRDS